MKKNTKIDSTVELIQGGPMIVKGSFEIIGSDGKKIEFTPTQLLEGVALCRCGKSQNKPFCDGSHMRQWGTQF